MKEQKLQSNKTLTDDAIQVWTDGRLAGLITLDAALDRVRLGDAIISSSQAIDMLPRQETKLAARPI